MNGGGEVEVRSGKLARFYGYRDSFNEHNIWVEVPKRGTQILSIDLEQRADGCLE
jgi:hypothetical protein